MGVSSTNEDHEAPFRDRLVQLAEAPLLSAAEELACAATIADGWVAELELAALDHHEGLDLCEAEHLYERMAHGDGARRRLIDSSRRLVVGLARRHAGDGVSAEALLAAGDDALVRAADRYDPTGGLPFSAFAKWWVERALREVEHIAVPAGPEVLTALGHLHQEDCRVIELRLGLGGGPALSGDDTARVLGIDARDEVEREQVAMAKLRHPSTPGDLTHLRAL